MVAYWVLPLATNLVLQKLRSILEEVVEEAGDDYYIELCIDSLLRWHGCVGLFPQKLV